MATQGRPQQPTPSPRPPSTALALVGSDDKSLTTLFSDVGPKLEKMLTQSMRIDRLFAIVANSVKSAPELAQSTRWSFLNSIVACVKSGLYPGVRGHCFLIPRRTGPVVPGTGSKAFEAHFQMGYRGYVELSYRSPLVARVVARVVRAGDVFSYEHGTSENIIHRPPRAYRTADDQKPVAAYAIGWIRGVQQPNFEVMEDWEIAQIRAFAREEGRRSSPWRGPFASEMYRKCPMTRLFKWMPSSEEIQMAAVLDERSMTGNRQPVLDETAELADGMANMGDYPTHDEPLEGEVVQSEEGSQANSSVGDDLIPPE